MKNGIYPSAHEFSALAHDAPGRLGLGINVMNPDVSNSEGSSGTPDSPARGPPLRRRHTRKALPRSRPGPGERLLRGRQFTTPDIVDAHESGYDEEMADVEAREPKDPVLWGFAEKVWMLLAR